MTNQTAKHSCIRFANVCKSFGSLKANDEVSFSIAENTIHGLVGENGAGKSTIMNVLYGMYPKDAGQIFLREREVYIKHPVDAIHLGIGMVHQHFMLVPTLTVWENLVLGQRRSFILKKTKVIAELEKFQADYGFKLPLTEKIKHLPVGQQQQVEILKLLLRKANILILDEPTAVLTPQESDTLFQRLKELKSKGKTIILITHKLKEILRFTEWVTILRQGRVVDSVPTSSLDEETLAYKIIGRKTQAPPKKCQASQQIVLKVDHLSLSTPSGRPILQDISFELRKGELLGVAGISGNGQEALVECLCQIQKHYTGSVQLDGEDLKKIEVYPLKRKGAAWIAPDRLEEAVVRDFNVDENILLGQHKESPFSHHKMIDHSACRKETARLMDLFDVRPRRTDLPIKNFSGGNQQKLVIARETHEDIKFLLASYPTRGVDVGAIEFIHHYLVKQKEKGCGILLISSELDEILSLSDRIIVLYGGKIVGEVKASEATETLLGKWMTGATSPQ